EEADRNTELPPLGFGAEGNQTEAAPIKTYSDDAATNGQHHGNRAEAHRTDFNEEQADGLYASRGPMVDRETSDKQLNPVDFMGPRIPQQLSGRPVQRHLSERTDAEDAFADAQRALASLAYRLARVELSCQQFSRDTRQLDYHVAESQPTAQNSPLP